MTLGIALVIIFVLYLIDKHNRWMQMLKIVVAMGVVAGLLYGSIYAYDRYATWRVTRCVAKSTPAGNATAAAEIEAACERDPSKPLVLDVSKAAPFDPNASYSDLPAGAKVVSITCGVDAHGHIVPDGRGGCVPPPPDGYIIDAPQGQARESR